MKKEKRKINIRKKGKQRKKTTIKRQIQIISFSCGKNFVVWAQRVDNLYFYFRSLLVAP